eukprot:m.143805 g.143805  ORF g.143805 m.143805 type:complete len:317 (+) comp52648_c0_seq6:27-977(+)
MRVLLAEAPGLLVGAAIAYVVPTDFSNRFALWYLLPVAFCRVTHHLFGARATTRPQTLALFAASLLVGVAFTIALSSYLSSWCCIREDDIRSICDATLEVTSILREANLPVWLCGSLLGAVRDSHLPMQSISWEHDVDLCLEDQYMDKAMEVLALRLPGVDTRKEKVHVQSYRATMGRFYVDLYRVSQNETDPDMLYMINGPPRPVSFSKSLIYPLQTMRYCDGQAPAPVAAEQLVTTFFGSSYQQPKLPNNLQGQCCRMYADCAVAASVSVPLKDTLYAWFMGLSLVLIAYFATVKLQPYVSLAAWGAPRPVNPV